MLYSQEPRQLESPSPTELAQAQSLLSKLYESITKLLIAGRSNQKEAKAWLLNAISSLDLRDAGLRRRKYGQFLPGGSGYNRTLYDFGKQLLQELFTDEPQKVARLISEEPSVLKRFFRQDPGHVRLWFGHFSMNGMADFKHGAHALARYALLNRDEVWRLLVWAGKHPQAPVAVAQKTHYFCELDVAATVANLLEECPSFWESQDLRDSMSSGQLLALAPTFWAEELYGWLKEFSRRSDRLFGLVCDYLESSADWRRLCGRLLPLLPHGDLLAFASGLLTDVSLPAAPACSLSGTAALTSQNSAGAWLVFRGSAQWGSLEELVLAAALGCNLRQLGRLVREEENAEELQEMLGLAETLNSSETSAAHWLLRGQLARRAKQPQQAQASQPDAAEGSAQEPGAGTGGSTVAANTAAAGAGLGAAGACWEGIHGFLLLHLWAAYLHLSSLALSVSSSSGSSGSLKQLQQLVAELDISCEPAEAQQQESAPGRGAWVGVDEDPLLAQFEGARKSKRRRREKRLGKDKEGSGRQEGKKKGRAAKGSHKHRRRKRRHRSSDSSSPSDGSSPRAGDASESGGGGELSTGVGGSGKDGHQHGRSRHFRGLSGAEEEEGLGHALRSGGQGSWGGKSLWTVHTPGGAVTTMAAAELVEYAMEQLARAYIGWLVSQGL